MDNVLPLVQSQSRHEFAASCPHLLLISTSILRPPGGPQRTNVEWVQPTARIDRLAPEDVSPRLVLAVAWQRSSFPEMITLGRTANNDLVVRDVSVSKFHAFFHTRGDRVEVADAGSRNGTWLDGRRLRKKVLTPVIPGIELRVGTVRFLALSAEECWDHVRAWDRARRAL